MALVGEVREENFKRLGVADLAVGAEPLDLDLTVFHELDLPSLARDIDFDAHGFSAHRGQSVRELRFLKTPNEVEKSRELIARHAYTLPDPTRTVECRSAVMARSVSSGTPGHSLRSQNCWTDRMGERFDRTWVPRIGPDAAAELRRDRPRYLLGAVTTTALAVAAVILFASGTAAGIALGAVCVVLSLAPFYAYNRARQPLADALSAHFGVKVKWWNMPSTQTGSMFDVWARRKGFTRPPSSN
jgi:hypothetical protein